MTIKKNRHSCYLLQYHFVVVTKYRHKVIKNDLKERLLGLSKSIFEESWNCEIIEMNTDQDHIHILFEAPPQVQLSKLVNSYKSLTARTLRKEFAEYLTPYYWKPVFWSSSYFICTVSEHTTSCVTEYIKTQGMKTR